MSEGPIDDVDTLLGASLQRRDPEQLRVPFRHGREAHDAQRPRDANPHTRGSLEGVAWRCGHDLARLLQSERDRGPSGVAAERR